MFPSCNFTWLDTLVNTYANNATERDPGYMIKCCPTPETCTDQTPDCPLEAYCVIGNNAYACKVGSWSPLGIKCYQDGLLATKRSLQCCNTESTQLTTFLANETCIEGYGTQNTREICCTDNSTASSCIWSSLCMNYPGYGGMVGSRYGVYRGTIHEQSCLVDITLGTEVRPGCMTQFPTNTSCPAPGMAPWGSVKPTPSSSPKKSSAPHGLAHSVRSTKSIIQLAILLFVPVVLQFPS